MEFRTSRKPLQHVWIAGCAYAALLLLVGIGDWILQGGFERGTLIGYGLGATLVLVFSRGLYHRSIVSGFLLLATALGPAVGETIQWMWRANEGAPSVGMVLRGAKILSGLGFSAVIIQAIYSLWRGGSSSESRPTRTKGGAAVD